MNRKLRDTLIALSASSLLLVVTLLAGNPQPLELRPSPHGQLADSMEWSEGAVEDADGTSRPAQRGVRDAARGRSAGHRKFALPYYSFAHGLRQGES
jgi:hypothetical protein